MRLSLIALVAFLTTAVFAGEPVTGVGRLNNVQFNWTASETKTGLVELTLLKTVPLRPVQVERLRHLPAGPILRAEDVVSGDLTKLTLTLNGSFKEALAQAARMVPGLSFRIVQINVDNPQGIVAEHR